MPQHICDHCGKSLANKHALSRHQDTCSRMINLGKELIAGFDKDSILELLEGDDIIIKLFKLINLDPEKPQYHNILCFHKESKNALVFKTNKWIKMDLEKMCEEVIDNKIRFLESFVEEHEIDSENVREQIELLANDVSAKKSIGRQIQRVSLTKKEMVKKSMGLLTSASVLASSLVSVAF